MTGSRVLDAGAGRGGFTAYILASYKKVSITAVTLGDVETKDKRVDVEALRQLAGHVGLGGRFEVIYGDISNVQLVGKFRFIVSDAGERKNSMKAQGAWFIESGYGSALLDLVKQRLERGGTLCVKLMGAGASAPLIEELGRLFKQFRALSVSRKAASRPRRCICG